MPDPMQPEDFDKMSDADLLAALAKSIKSADEWDKTHPDPKR